jgi:hypothetical protein
MEPPLSRATRPSGGLFRDIAASAERAAALPPVGVGEDRGEGTAGRRSERRRRLDTINQAAPWFMSVEKKDAPTRRQ